MFLLPESFPVRNSLIIIDLLADRQATRLVCRTTWMAMENSNLQLKLGSHWQRDLSFWETFGSFLLEASEFVLSIHR